MFFNDDIFVWKSHIEYMFAMRKINLLSFGDSGILYFWNNPLAIKLNLGFQLNINLQCFNHHDGTKAVKINMK